MRRCASPMCGENYDEKVLVCSGCGLPTIELAHIELQAESGKENRWDWMTIVLYCVFVVASLAMTILFVIKCLNET